MRLLVLIATWIAVFQSVQAAEPAGSKIWPERARIFIQASPDVALPFIVEAAPGRFEALANRLDGSAQFLFRGGSASNRIDLINSYSIVVTGADALRISSWEEVRSLWFIYRDMARTYVRAINGLAYALRTGPLPKAANLSLAPPASRIPQLTYDPKEPFNRASRLVTQRGLIVVLAAGNGGPGVNSLSPWCRAPWVICVGAAASDGKTLWDRSARGDPAVPGDGPTVVAPGVDILTTHPPGVPKSAAMLEAEKRVGFDDMVPAEKRQTYTVVSGTSIAAPRVSGMVAQILYYIQRMSELPVRGDKPDRTFAVIYNHEGQRPWAEVEREPRYAGEIKDFSGVRTAIYPLQATWRVVKQILIDTALAMPGYERHEVGAGFVHEDVVKNYFGAFGNVDIEIQPVKIR